MASQGGNCSSETVRLCATQEAREAKQARTSRLWGTCEECVRGGGRCRHEGPHAAQALLKVRRYQVPQKLVVHQSCGVAGPWHGKTAGQRGA